VVHIADALQLDEMEISESVVKEAQPMPNITVLGRPCAMSFDKNKNLISKPPSG